MSIISGSKVRAFLREGTRTGTPSFLAPSGRRLVWFVRHGDSVSNVTA